MVAEPLSLVDVELRARDALDPATYAFFAGGAGDELALAANRSAFERRVLRPRVLVDVSAVTTRSTVLGKDVALPVLVAPVGFQTLLDDEGELATARAAGRSETVMCVSTISEASPAEIAAAAPGARLWFQIYCFRDRELTAGLLRQAAAAGFEAIVLTVDGPVLGRRERALAAGFRMPDRFRVRGTAGTPGHPFPASAGELAELLDPSLNWNDLEWIVSTTGLPLILKGILAAEDASLACEHGAAAIIVSNHGGRQLDAAPAALDALPDVVAAVGGDVEVLVDGGIRRGTDVLVALALGARAVLIGRPAMWGLADDGEAGVVRVLDLLRDELENALALSGCTSPQDAVPAMVGSAMGVRG
jgi:isopentenyl diphosphate isomerase/L-lactate dehydrogenase-like FMN-dependent dehydrogenase